MTRALQSTAAIGILLCLAGPAAAYNGKLLNGKAVSVQYRFGNWGLCEASNSPWRGSLIVYTLQDSRVTHVDTIYKREQAFAHYAAFNLSGTKIAFYRLGQGVSSSGSCVTVNGGKSYISTINPDGTGLTDLCELPAMPSNTEIFPLDWPAGDWIYYTRPHDAAHTYNGNNGSTVIWRVNSVTKVNEAVCNLTDNGSGIEEQCNTIRRFTLSVKGDRMGLMYMAGGKGGCTADVINNHQNNIHTFPPANCAINGSSIAGAAGCNIAISPSGLIHGSYFAGAHDQLMLGTVGDGPGISIPRGVWIGAPLYNPGCAQCIMEGLAGNLTKWTGEFVGRGAELIRWSANSDKWVMQKIGNGFDGHAGDNDNGSNQVVCNFMDEVAINISKNPPPPIPYPSGYVFWNNDAGDLWVSDPGNNPNGDRYEDVQGRWLTVDGAVAVSHIAVTPLQVFTPVEKDSALTNRTVQVTNVGIGTLNAIATQVRYGAGATNWLTVTTSGTGNTQQLTLQFRNTAFAAGTYHATVAVFAPGTPDSALVPVELSIQTARSPDNPGNAVPGLSCRYYEGLWFPTPGFDTLTPVKISSSTNFDLSAVPANHHENYGLCFDGYIDVPTPGMYTFYLGADDMARLSIGSTLLVTSDWLHGRTGSIALKPGKHAVRLEMSQMGGGDGLSVEWECAKAGIAKQNIPSNRLFNTGGATLASLRPARMSTPSASGALYNLQGKRVGTLTNGMRHGLSRSTGLFVMMPAGAAGRASKAVVVVR